MHSLGWCKSDVFRLLGWIVQTEMETCPPCQPVSPLAWSGPGSPLSAELFKLLLLDLYASCCHGVAIQASNENVVALLVALSRGCP